MNPLKKQANILKIAEIELMNVARRDMPSVLRNRSYEGLCQDNWMAEVISEISTRCPTVAQILSTLMGCDLAVPENGIIMFIRCKELSRVQRINTVLLTEGKATTNVS